MFKNGFNLRSLGRWPTTLKLFQPEESRPVAYDAKERSKYFNGVKYPPSYY